MFSSRFTSTSLLALALAAAALAARAQDKMQPAQINWPTGAAGCVYAPGTNTCVSASGGGVSNPTLIDLTAAPYYASPYGATTTTGTFGAGATSGTVGSCSTFVANEGVLIAGGATGGWNGISYIGTVVSCSGTTLTINPAITTAVTNATVQHDETHAFASAITALGTLGGTISLPNAANNMQGVYLVNGALQDPTGANAIINMPVIAGSLSSYSLVIQGADAGFSSPEIKTSLSTSGANLIGAYGSTDGHFTGVGLYLKDLTIQGPSSGSETLVNGTWMQALSTMGTVQILGASSGIPTTGNGILFPTIANNVRLVSTGFLAVGGFGTAVRLGEHNQVQDLLINNSTNGVVFDVAPTGLLGDNTQNSISVSHIWCGPPSVPNGSTTVTNCLVGGTSATTIHVGDVDYEGTGGTLISDPSNFLHGDVNYALNNTAACPTTPTVSGGANLVLRSLNCTTGGTKTATQGATTPAHMAVFGSDGHDIVDGGAVPASGFANPMTSLGDLIAGGASGAATRVAGNTSTTAECLTQTGTGTASAAPVWGACSGTGGAIVLENGGTSLGSVTTLNCSTGTNCSSASGVGTLTATSAALPFPPAAATFTGVNAGTTTLAASGNYLLLSMPSDATLNWRLYTQTVPATPWALSTYIANPQVFTGSSATDIGIYLYDGTKLEGIEDLCVGAGSAGHCSTTLPGFMRVERITNVTTDSAAEYGGDTSAWNFAVELGSEGKTGVYVRWCDNGTNLYAESSQDGLTWFPFYSEAVGAWITPTKVGFGGVNEGSGATLTNYLKGWSLGTVASCP